MRCRDKIIFLYRNAKVERRQTLIPDILLSFHLLFKQETLFMFYLPAVEGDTFYFQQRHQAFYYGDVLLYRVGAQRESCQAFLFATRIIQLLGSMALGHFHCYLSLYLQTIIYRFIWVTSQLSALFYTITVLFQSNRRIPYSVGSKEQSTNPNYSMEEYCGHCGVLSYPKTPLLQLNNTHVYIQ